MPGTSFIINDRFIVHTDTNVVVDREEGVEMRIEPRLMKLLCALAEREGQLVERTQLITSIWNNYGGADDALTQAISFLRKVLRDDAKQIITTVPKGGYILHATITPADPGTQPNKNVRIPSKALIVAGALVMILLVWWSMRNGDSAAPPAPLDVSGDHEEAQAPEAP